MTAEFEKFLDMLPLVGAIMNVPAHCERRGEHVISNSRCNPKLFPATRNGYHSISPFIGSADDLQCPACSLAILLFSSSNLGFHILSPPHLILGVIAGVAPADVAGVKPIPPGIVPAGAVLTKPLETAKDEERG